MKITAKTIMSWEPCEGYNFEIIENLIKKTCGRRKTVKAEDVFNCDIPDQDKLWLLLRKEFIPEKELHLIAIWCWEKIARPIWEKYYPNDKRPHEAIRIKKRWLKGKATDKELAAARDAWDATWAAARDARAATWAAARDATWAAAREAASAAARDARAATWAAAWDATWAAARAAVNKKILDHCKDIIAEICKEK